MSDDDLEPALLAVLDYYGWPEPRYGEHPMRCPVHDDRVASASVNRSKGLWNCHACGKGGSAVEIVMERESCSYPAARELIEQLTGKALKPKPQKKTRRSSGKRWVPPALRRAM